MYDAPQPPRGPAETTIQRLRRHQALDKLVGESPIFVEAIATLPALARSDAAVLITGETGTGKELAARAIHYMGARAPHPFVPVNCGSLPDSLLEDELFGHEAGAFTDARAKRVGLVVQAERGTLFLDEVDSLTPRAQVSLLRLLQDRTYRPLGSSAERRADVRFIAASNVPLAKLVRDGAFRADLYYRLCVLWVHLPSLRERRQDILRLARHFVVKHASGPPAPGALTPDAEAALLASPWPGNIRELENAIIRALSVAQGSAITRADLGLGSASTREPAEGSAVPLRTLKELKREFVDAFERDYLMQLMVEHGGNVSHAAMTAGKERRDLGKLLKKHQLNPRDFAGTR